MISHSATIPSSANVPTRPIFAKSIRATTGNEAEVQRHRIIRPGITFGPEVAPGETTTRHSRGLMFVCYQTSIERQFEFIQRSYANNPDFVGGKGRPGGGAGDAGV